MEGERSRRGITISLLSVSSSRSVVSLIPSKLDTEAINQERGKCKMLNAKEAKMLSKIDEKVQRTIKDDIRNTTWNNFRASNVSSSVTNNLE